MGGLHFLIPAKLSFLQIFLLNIQTAWNTIGIFLVLGGIDLVSIAELKCKQFCEILMFSYLFSRQVA